MSSEKSRDRLVVRNSEILDAARDDQKILFHPVAGLYCDLDEVATRVWDLMGESRTLEDLVSSLMVQYPVGRDTCLRDTLAFLTILADKGFVSLQPVQPRS